MLTPAEAPAPQAADGRPLAFLFSAQGATWAGMGRDLMAADESFRGAITECDRAIRRHFDWSLCRELEAEPRVYRLHLDHQMVQPALTSLQIALTRSLASRGVRPDAVGSLSMGQAAAAWCAGALDLEGAIDIACSTARLADTSLRPGLMAFVRSTWRDAGGLIADVRDRVELAVELGRELTVISGEEVAVRRTLSLATAAGVGCGPLPLAQAYHSGDVASLARGFKDRLAGLRTRPARLPSYSSVSGSRQERAETVDDWWRICSEPSRFYTVALAMVGDGYRHFVEIGPHPMLAGAIHEAAASLLRSPVVHAVMQRGAGAIEGVAAIARALAAPTGESA